MLSPTGWRRTKTSLPFVVHHKVPGSCNEVAVVYYETADAQLVQERIEVTVVSAFVDYKIHEDIGAAQQFRHIAKLILACERPNRYGRATRCTSCRTA